MPLKKTGATSASGGGGPAPGGAREIRVVVFGAFTPLGLRLVDRLTPLIDIGFKAVPQCDDPLPIKSLVLPLSLPFLMKCAICTEQTLVDTSSSPYEMTEMRNKLVMISPRIKVMKGDPTNRFSVDRMMATDSGDTSRITVLNVTPTAEVAAEGNDERAFQASLERNIDGTRNILNALHAASSSLGGPQVLVTASSHQVVAVNDKNRSAPANHESFRLSSQPQGILQACSELLVCGFSHQGFVDGRVGRVCHVIDDPSVNDSTTCYPFTGIFKETLVGKDAVCAVPFPMNTRCPCTTLDLTADCFLYLAQSVEAEELGDNRVVQLPARSVTLSEVWEATQRVSKEHQISLGSVQEVNPHKEMNVCPEVSFERARDLGLPVQMDALESLIHSFASAKDAGEEASQQISSQRAEDPVATKGEEPSAKEGDRGMEAQPEAVQTTESASRETMGE